MHAEMNNWFRRTTEHYSSTVQIKLVIFQCMKLLTHNRAMYSACTHQMDQSLVLARELGVRQLWQPEDWAGRCLEQRCKTRLRAKISPKALSDTNPYARLVVSKAFLRHAQTKAGTRGSGCTMPSLAQKTSRAAGLAPHAVYAEPGDASALGGEEASRQVGMVPIRSLLRPQSQAPQGGLRPCTWHAAAQRVTNKNWHTP